MSDVYEAVKQALDEGKRVSLLAEDGRFSANAETVSEQEFLAMLGDARRAWARERDHAQHPMKAQTVQAPPKKAKKGGADGKDAGDDGAF